MAGLSYLTGVRGLEERLAADADAVCEPTLRPDEIYDADEHLALMTDLVVTAFRCDLTRVVTLMLGNGGSGRSFTFVDPSVTGGHHDISHHQDDPENFRKLEIIDKWEVRKIAELARRLHAETDAEGPSLLDQSVIYLGSEISDGNAHNHSDMPVLMLGRCGGTLTPGHLRRADEPMANLFITLLANVGVSVPSFGDDSTGPMSLLEIGAITGSSHARSIPPRGDCGDAPARGRFASPVVRRSLVSHTPLPSCRARRVPSPTRSSGRALVLIAALGGSLGACSADAPAAEELEGSESALTAAQCTYFADGDDKVQVCHRTSSTKNAYVIIRTNLHGCIEGHADHAGDYVAVNDPTCRGLGCLPATAPCEPTVPCCEGLECVGADGAPAEIGHCVARDLCAEADCDDHDACTSDGCDPSSGCTHEPIVCDDKSVCTEDACDPVTGCASTPIPCDDHDACTNDDCDATAGCRHTQIGCDDGDACTTDGCDEASGCTHAAIGCDDGNPCTTDGCNPATGCTNVPVTCPSADACTNVACVPAEGGCVSSPVVCDDGNACTGDACDPTDGCTAAPISCDDGNPCTVDGCDPTDGCTHAPVTCPSTDACTNVACVPAEGGCVSSPVVCDDGNACTNNACDPATGCTSAPILCDDFDACTIDSCDSIEGCITEQRKCDDDNPCTTDGCDPSTGCTNVPVTCPSADAGCNATCTATVSDYIEVNGECTLSEAVALANDNLKSRDGCARVEGPFVGSDVIVFASSVTGPIALGAQTVIGDLIIDGPDWTDPEARLTVVATGAHHFDIQGASLVLRDLHLTGAGGRSALVPAAASLSVERCRFADNVVDGAIGVGGGHLEVLDSEFISNVADFSDPKWAFNNFEAFGGAIVVWGGSAHINRSYFGGNRAIAPAIGPPMVTHAYGGALYLNAGATVVIENSTFFANQVQNLNPDGASHSESLGGAIAAFASELTVVASTFADNSVSGGHERTGGQVFVMGGGTSFDLTANIITGSAWLWNPGSSDDSRGHNLHGLPAPLPAPAYNGGSTKTIIAPDEALDQVPADLCLDTDQRGITRDHLVPGGPEQCDIGAYERTP